MVVEMGPSRAEAVPRGDALSADEVLSRVFYERYSSLVGLARLIDLTDERYANHLADTYTGPAAFVSDDSIAVTRTRDGRSRVVVVDPFGGWRCEQDTGGCKPTKPKSLRDDEATLFDLDMRPEFLRVDASGRNILLGLEAEDGYDIRSWSREDGFRISATFACATSPGPDVSTAFGESERRDPSSRLPKRRLNRWIEP